MSVTLWTSHGQIKLELFISDAPRTCRNFLALCAAGYYNNCHFHRNIPRFIAQSGDPTNTGKTQFSIYGPSSEQHNSTINASMNREYYFQDEIDTSKPHLRHTLRGTLSMANSGPNTNAAQFFITYAPNLNDTLDGKYTVFGRVIDGWNTLDRMEKVGALAASEEGASKKEVVVIERVHVHANPIADEDGD